MRKSSYICLRFVGRHQNTCQGIQVSSEIFSAVEYLLTQQTFCFSKKMNTFIVYLCMAMGA